MNGLRLGIDLGTSSLKAALLSEDGRVLANGQAGYRTLSGEAGQAEQNPADWLNAAGRAVQEIGRTAPPGWKDRLEAIGLAGQLPTLVCIGRDGPIGRAITWQDSRADAWVSERLDAASLGALYRATGMPVDGRYLGPMFRHHRWAAREDISCILSAKDYLAYAFTGRTVTDPSTAAGYATYGLAAGAWLPDLCAMWDISPEILPEILASGDVCGPLHPDSAQRLGLRQGTPVHVGCADSVAGAFAMTGFRSDIASIAMGSSTILFAATPDLALDPDARFLLTPHAVPDWYGREMDLLSTGTGLQWLAGLLSLPLAQLETLALKGVAGAGGVAFAPYLAGGEQGALWDPTLSGVLHGLSTEVTGSDLARAYLEGVFFEMRRCLDVLGDGTAINGVVLSGAAVSNPELVQLLADAIGRPVQGFQHASPSAIGAAMLGAPEAARKAVASHLLGPEIVPGSMCDIYDLLYQRHIDLFPRIARPAKIETR